MANKPTHTASLMYEEKDKDSKTVTRFHEICQIRENEKGNMFINIPKGMLLSWKVIITKNKERDNNQETLDENTEWDLPF